MAGKKPVSAASFHKQAKKRANKAAASAKKRARPAMGKPSSSSNAAVSWLASSAWISRATRSVAGELGVLLGDTRAV